MSIRPRIWLLSALIGFGAWQYWQDRPVSTPDGQLAPESPQQTDLKTPQTYTQGQYTLTALARYDITARVLGKERYTFDAGAELVPVDLALGWGAMSDSSVLQSLDISQNNRFYFYRWRDQPPIPAQDIVSHSANTHLIPSSPSIEKKIKSVRPGQIVRIQGSLVEAKAPDGRTWRSSLTRDDSGNGACELVYVESFTIF